MSTSTTPPIVIRDDSAADGDYVPTSRITPRKPKQLGRRPRESVSPVAKRIRLGLASSSSSSSIASFMTATQPTAGSSRKSQVPITRFFAYPGRQPMYQPSSNRPAYFPTKLEVVLPGDDNEPLAPVPSAFTYRSLSPAPRPSVSCSSRSAAAVLAPSSTSAMNGGLVGSDVRHRNVPEITWENGTECPSVTLSKAAAESVVTATEPVVTAAEPVVIEPQVHFKAVDTPRGPSANLMAQSLPTQSSHGEARKRVWAAVPTIRRGSSSSVGQIPPHMPPSPWPGPSFSSFPAGNPPTVQSDTALLPSFNIPSSQRASTPIPSAFVSQFKAVPTISRRPLPTPTKAEVTTAEPPLRFPEPPLLPRLPAPPAPSPVAPLNITKSSCESCNRTFVVKSTSTLSPDGNGHLCPGCATDMGTSTPNNINRASDMGLPEGLLPAKRKRVDSPEAPDSRLIVGPDMADMDPPVKLNNGGPRGLADRSPGQSDVGRLSFNNHDASLLMWSRVEGSASLSSAAKPAVKTPTKKIKLYTPGSMSINGSYGLTSTQDIQETSEDEKWHHNSRAKKTEWMVWKKQEAAPVIPQVLAPFGEQIMSRELNALAVDSSPRLDSLVHLDLGKPRKISVLGACEAHNDPDCTEVSCVYDFFEEYNPFCDVNEIRTEPRRSGNHDPIRQTVPENQQYLNDAAKAKVQQEEFALSLAARTTGERRPYMSLQARAFLRQMGDWPGFDSYNGCIIHVDFTAMEVELVRYYLSKGERALRDTKVTFQIGLHASQFQSWQDGLREVMRFLPGRTGLDVVKFVQDCRRGYRADNSHQLGSTFIKVTQRPNLTTNHSPVPPNPSLRLFRELGKGIVSWGSPSGPTRVMRLRTRDEMQPWKVFTGGSSDILDICWSPDGRRFGLSCCTFDDQYNRPGNLMVGSLDNMMIRMLDGHKVPRRNVSLQAILDPYLYSTVTSVKYSRDGQLFFSGSYDETVKIWLGDGSALLNSVDLKSAVSHLATSPAHTNIIAAGCKNGDVNVIRLDDYGNLECNPFVFRPAKKNLEAATLAWCNSLRPNWLIAGYDSRLEKGTSGDLLIFDVVSEKVALNVTPGSNRQFDVFLDEQGTMFATAAAASSSRSGKKIKTQIRLYNLAGNTGRNTRALAEFDSEQIDINKVTVSPCETYVTSSGTDGSTHIWDRRNQNQTLHVLKHGDSLMVPLVDGNPEEDDTGVTVALWGSTNDRLYTGGSDGVVKIWDIKRGDPLIRDFATMDSQIMSASFSPEFDLLMVGECSGKATLFSSQADKGAPPDPFDIDISEGADRGGVEAEDEDEEETGFGAARALVRAGKMVVRDGFAWATGR